MRTLFLGLFWAVLPTFCFGQSYSGDDLDLGSGFVEVEGGWMRLLGRGRHNLDDAALVGLNVGISLTKEFKSEEDYEPLKIGPKLGFIVGRVKSTNEAAFFWDALLKARYTFGTSSLIRFYLDTGPGALNYGETAFQIEAGGGVNFVFGTGSVGANTHFKEVIGSKFFDRALEFMGSLGYQF